MKPRTIVRIIARLNIGGPAQHAVWLSTRFGPPDWRTILVVGQLADDEGDMSDLAARYGVTPLVIPQLGRQVRPWDDVTALVKILRVVWRERPDIIHTHTAKAGTLGRLAAWAYNLTHPRRRCRVVHTFHGHVFSGYFSKWVTRVFLLIERCLARSSDCLITVSHRVREELLELGIGRPEQVTVVPLGIDLEPFVNRGQTPALIKRGSAPMPVGAPLTIGIVGRLVPIKNHRLFLEAAKQLQAMRPQEALRFLVVGDGALREDLVCYVNQLGLVGKVEFLGWRRDLAEIYSEMDIVALTSWNEGSPVSLIEAMASARPVVATDVGGVRELLSGESGASRTAQRPYEVLAHGILIPPGEATSCAEALHTLLSRPELRRAMGQAGRAFVQQRYSLDRLAKDLTAVYDGSRELRTA